MVSVMKFQFVCMVRWSFFVLLRADRPLKIEYIWYVTQKNLGYTNQLV